MTIGEALKEEQKQLGLTAKAMAAGVISKATYSKVVNGKQKLSSDSLVKILFKNNIDIDDFFEMLKSTYMSESRQYENKLFNGMQLALNNHKIDMAQRYLVQIETKASNKYLQQRAKITVAFLTGNMDKLNNEFKQSVIDTLNSHPNCMRNIDALGLFNTALLILPNDEVEIEMRLFFTKVVHVKKISESMKERYAILCCNYLDWKYKRSSEINKNVINALKYLKR
ncbi:helix-turn-helix domain-containing protein [Lactobacillus kefiranofaciens]|uniref:Helix-turn-helix domain-containing protein n=1 Tax=Lactobacillus kefiranofaciens TaxID=267818 RepID=A0AAX3UDZ3_9LACO|nr:helix-turn-helix transcriptional regulator [Lactobacillus kefiranofaciens]AEG40799.1 Transcriptional regulator [Lactobacillus kefiranofaciens subsp. kefiranofaciens]KRM19692.1 ArsR family transcriptional regulator [Lactobacillus kefiranofaciens subsp. kefiranofaciens DSM 5016 = JCM 6985]MCP9331473.1 helix-turn-helix domain-containing protein [Lactobacillus kefiranofaciens]PAK97772.1 transcriptional regulator [Lactobacillus kefiranofaciens]QFQ68480.1 helix-turn-helix domain-containing protei